MAIKYYGGYVTCIDTINDSTEQIVTWSWLDGVKVVTKTGKIMEYICLN